MSKSQRMARKREMQQVHSIRDEYPDHPRQCPVTPIRTESGCKVYWLWFASKKDAEVAAKWAEVEANIRYRQGYDSGYCSPGSIEERNGEYRVCCL